MYDEKVSVKGDGDDYPDAGEDAVEENGEEEVAEGRHVPQIKLNRFTNIPINFQKIHKIFVSCNYMHFILKIVKLLQE